MLVSELAAILQPSETSHSSGALINGLAFDSRRVTPGMVFFALQGNKTDGHKYIEEALTRGACAIVTERRGAAQNRVAEICVGDARLAMARAAAAFHAHPSHELKLIGVTGTNGKTTVSFIIQHLLQNAGTKTGLLGTVRYEIGDRAIPAQRTTPESVVIQQYLREMIRAGCTACVMEVSSHSLVQQRVECLKFDVAVFTNLTGDHLDYHADMEGYYQAKEKLFCAGIDRPAPANAVINSDDPFGRRLAQANSVADVTTYAIDSEASIRAGSIQLDAQETRFELRTKNGVHACRMPFIGRHNIYNALAAVGACVRLGMTLEDIVRGLENAPPVPGRLEPVSSGQPFGVFIDYAHTDDALQQVLATLRQVTRGRLIVAFGCGGNRDAGKRSRMGAVAARMADCTVITSDNPRRESAEEIASAIGSGFLAACGKEPIIELDRRAAIERVIGMAKPGDIVLIAGKGHETYQEFAETVIPFDDGWHARQALEAMGFGG